MEKKNFADLNLTEEEKKLINKRSPQLNNKTFNSNILFARANISTTEVVQMTLDKDAVEYITKLNECLEQGESQILPCIMRLNCSYSLTKYAQCVVQYPKGMESLCLNYKHDIEKCYQRPIRNAKLAIFSDLIESSSIS
ncbi:unnamed protein product [Moneuplotes crassus]|uniref:Uncharacterized protein n=1 Tax=Euplotes crassus TaxID=5936 RepID=A0AAD2D6X5_EUPCR|nr:unnamed protein product [Moneuplotes crassus]